MFAKELRNVSDENHERETQKGINYCHDGTENNMPPRSLEVLTDCLGNRPHDGTRGDKQE